MSIELDYTLFSKPEFLAQVGKGLINTIELAVKATDQAPLQLVIIVF